MDVFQFIPDPVAQPLGFLRNIIGNSLGNRLFYPVLLGPLISLFVINKAKWNQVIFISLNYVIPILLLLFMSIYRKYWFVQRHFIYTTPLFIYWVSWCWDSAISYFWGRTRDSR